MEGKGKVNEPKHPGVPDKSAQKKVCNCQKRVNVL